MADDSPVTMDRSACDTLLAETDTGVLSLSTPPDDPPYSVPVSFGYDPVESVLYFRLAEEKGREDGTLDGRVVSFVTHAQTDGNWQSVVARGELERTTTEGIELETLEGLERVHIPIVDIFGAPTSDVEFEFFRLVPDALTGRKEAPSGL
jgi:nitroimidazol reductase NimA-like FMN-containing flavoprotein (pyridoxamine 5'-phosphate oxidase superfamily)